MLLLLLITPFHLLFSSIFISPIMLIMDTYLEVFLLISNLLVVVPLITLIMNQSVNLPVNWMHLFSRWAPTMVSSILILTLTASRFAFDKQSWHKYRARIELMISSSDMLGFINSCLSWYQYFIMFMCLSLWVFTCCPLL